MQIADWIQVILFIVIVALISIPLGAWMAKIFTGKPNFLSPVIGWFETKVLTACGVATGEEMDWKQFAVALMVFAVPCIGAVFILQEVQQFLPLNPAGLGAVPWDLSLNTAISFATNTNWQAYVPEVTVSYFTQMAGLVVENFISAAVGLAVLIALIYAFSRRSATTIGNFWVLLVRSVMILIPIALVISLVLVSQGTPQTFSGPATVPLLDPVKDSTGALVTTQTIPLGPVASQVAIKMLGTNGGGYYNANSAHPLENPTPFSNIIEMLAMIIIPAALCLTFGTMIGSRRKGVALILAMTLIFLPLLGFAIWSEQGGNPVLTPLGIDQTPSALQSGGNMEGKEVRFGIVPSVLFAVVTTSTSCGAVNSMHDSFMPVAGGIVLFDIHLGEVVFGGVGSGLYGMLVFVIIAMFIAGLMVGRTPELYGKKIEQYRDEDGDNHHPHPDRHDPRLHIPCRPHDCRPGRRRKPRAARFYRDPVRVYLGLAEQWQRLCRAECRQPFLHYHHLYRDVYRALRDHYPDPCTRRIACHKKDRPPQRRDALGPPAALYFVAGLCNPHCRRAQFPASALAWSHRGVHGDGRRRTDPCLI